MISASEFNNLKARVKAECLRRKYTGSVESYGDSSYDYTEPAAAGKIIRYEHYSKIADPLTAIDGKSRTPRSRINRADITEMTTAISSLESKSMYASTLANTGCAAQCTGLCYGTCTGGCSGTCSGGCGGNCTGDCFGSCWALCAESCQNTCSGTCTGGCSNSCGLNCQSYCTIYCGDTCVTECGGGCNGGARSD